MNGRYTYWRRLAQYARAAVISASAIREACGAGVLYGVVANVHLEKVLTFEHGRSRMLIRVEYIKLKELERETHYKN